jgi:hypothetical protein
MWFLPTNMSRLQQKIYRLNRQTFHIRFQEHFRDFKYKNGKSKFAHLIDNGHSITTMENVMEILHVTKIEQHDEYPRNDSARK